MKRKKGKQLFFFFDPGDIIRKLGRPEGQVSLEIFLEQGFKSRSDV